jgi:hypothetical protein
MTLEAIILEWEKDVETGGYGPSLHDRILCFLNSGQFYTEQVEIVNITVDRLRRVAVGLQTVDEEASKAIFDITLALQSKFPT